MKNAVGTAIPLDHLIICFCNDKPIVFGSHSSSPLWVVLVLSVNILSLTRLNMRGAKEGEDGIDAGIGTSVFNHSDGEDQ